MITLLALVLYPAALHAQVEETAAKEPVAEGSKDKRADDRDWHRRSRTGLDPETRALLEEVMVARLSKELSLDDKETVVLVRKFSEFRDEVIASRKQRMKIMRQLRTEIKEGQDGEDIEALLTEMIAEDDKMHASRKVFFEHIGEDLTPWQRGRLYVFLSEFEMDMRRLTDTARHHKSRDWDGNKGGEKGNDNASEDRESEASEEDGSANP